MCVLFSLDTIRWTASPHFEIQGWPVPLISPPSQASNPSASKGMMHVTMMEQFLRFKRAKNAPEGVDILVSQRGTCTCTCGLFVFDIFAQHFPLDLHRLWQFYNVYDVAEPSLDYSEPVIMIQIRMLNSTLRVRRFWHPDRIPPLQMPQEQCMCQHRWRHGIGLSGNTHAAAICCCFPMPSKLSFPKPTRHRSYFVLNESMSYIDRENAQCNTIGTILQSSIFRLQSTICLQLGKQSSSSSRCPCPSKQESSSFVLIAMHTAIVEADCRIKCIHTPQFLRTRTRRW